MPKRQARQPEPKPLLQTPYGCIEQSEREGDRERRGVKKKRERERMRRSVDGNDKACADTIAAESSSWNHSGVATGPVGGALQGQATMKHNQTYRMRSRDWQEVANNRRKLSVVFTQ